MEIYRGYSIGESGDKAYPFGVYLPDGTKVYACKTEVEGFNFVDKSKREERERER